MKKIIIFFICLIILSDFTAAHPHPSSIMAVSVDEDSLKIFIQALFTLNKDREEAGEYLNKNFKVYNNQRRCGLKILDYSKANIETYIDVIAECEERIGSIKISNRLFFEEWPDDEFVHTVSVSRGDIEKYIFLKKDSYEFVFDYGLIGVEVLEDYSKEILKENKGLDRITGNAIGMSIVNLARKTEDSSVFFILTIFLALLFGGLHALGPGHGKLVITSYVLGHKKSRAGSALLGLIVGITHVATTIFLVLGLYLYSNDVKMLFLSLTNKASAFGIIAVGLFMLIHQYIHLKHKKENISPGKKSMILLAFFTGLVPCSVSLVVFLLLLSINLELLALFAALAFVIGQVIMITGIAVAASKLKEFLVRSGGQNKFVKYLPFLASFMIIILGIVMAVRI
jgi:ABC-type nickel/cobalt efflux system permease component RcnA